MIHEHEAAEVASAAIDFGLAPELERELALSLRECPVCAERAAAYREQIRLMQRLPVLDASEGTRQRVAAAALSGRAATRSPMVYALAAALLIGLLLALTAAAGALLNDRDELSAVATASPSLVPSTPLAAAPTPTMTNPLGSGPLPDGAGGGFMDVLTIGSPVGVVSDNLRVRSAPSVDDEFSDKLVPFLQPGDRLYLIDGPVIADDYAWYRVAPIGTDRDRPWMDLPTGWVARGDHDGTPWIELQGLECPPAPVEIARLNQMHPFERVTCYEGAPMSFQAVIEGGPQSGWIADARRSGTQIQGMAVEIDPASAASAGNLEQGRAVLLEGSFGGDRCLDAGDAEDRLRCRSLFSLTRVVVDPLDIDPGDLLVTVTDNLRLRERPLVEEPGKLELLADGTRLAVLNGPAVASGYTWYEVAVPEIRAADGSSRVGWIAAHDRNREPWVGKDEFNCPRPNSVSVEDLSFLTSPSVFHGGLACYGAGGPYADDTVTVDGNLRIDCGGPPATGSHWLMDRGRTVVILDGPAEVRAMMRPFPAVPCDGATSPEVYRARGHFDDPDSGLCRRNDAVSVETDQVAVHDCRSQFVVTELFVIGPGPTPQPSF